MKLWLTVASSKRFWYGYVAASPIGVTWANVSPAAACADVGNANEVIPDELILSVMVFVVVLIAVIVPCIPLSWLGPQIAGITSLTSCPTTYPQVTDIVTVVVDPRPIAVMMRCFG